MSSRLAVITARGGSKRIPGKNIKEFCGKPIIAYSIEAAIDSRLFDEVMVSTDSEEIAEIAKKYGAKIPFMRSAETAGDFATTAEVIMEVITCYKHMGREFDTVVCIYPTAPFVTADKLREAVERLESSKAVEVRPVVKFSYPPQRGFVANDGYIQMKNPEYRDTRSQDLEPIYHDAGQFYCWNTKKFLDCDGKITSGIAPLFVREMEVQDIDSEEDWRLAELKYSLIKKV